MGRLGVLVVAVALIASTAACSLEAVAAPDEDYQTAPHDLAAEVRALRSLLEPVT